MWSPHKNISRWAREENEFTKENGCRLTERAATRHTQDLAGDVAGVVGGQKDEGGTSLRDILFLAGRPGAQTYPG